MSNAHDSAADRPTLIFVHLPKAAGSTLRNVIVRQYPEAEQIDFEARFAGSLERRLQQINAERIARGRCFYGHMSYGLHRLLERPCQYITVLRDPADRLVSLYYFALTETKTQLYRRVIDERMSLEEFAACGVSPDIDNGQTRQLSGLPDLYRFDEIAPCPPEALDAAIANLEGLTAFGLAERFDESVLLMQEALGWPDVRYFSDNVNYRRPRREPIPESALGVIEARNHLDRRLYQHAVQVFDARVAKRGEAFQAALRRFRFWNGLRCSWRARLNRIRQTLSPP